MTTSTRFTARVKAFSCEGIRLNRIQIDADGTVRVYDSIAGHYTRCHSLSPKTQARLRKAPSLSSPQPTKPNTRSLTMTTTLRNKFHNTSYRTSMSREEIDARLARVDLGTATETEKTWAAKVRRTLCGIKGCTCAQNTIGERS